MTKEQDRDRNAEEILFRFLDGTATGEEKVWAKKWIGESVDHAKKFKEWQVHYNWFNKDAGTRDSSKEASWSRIRAGYYQSIYLSYLAKEKLQTRKKMAGILVSSAIVAVFAFFTGIYVNNIHHRDHSGSISNQVYNEVYVPLGARSQVTLSDGTRVWINAGSLLRYPSQFRDDSREVILKGEAYFDVSKMPDKIFIVKTSDIKVKVYGTQFNIKSYPEENTIQTTLVDGSLSVEPIRKKGFEKPVFLKPRQSLTYYKKVTPGSGTEASTATGNNIHKMPPEGAKIVVIPSIDPVPVTSWKDSKWVIVHEHLDEFAVKLERRYNVKITFENENLKNYIFSGTLKDETFEQVLKIMQISAPLLFTVDKNQVTFREDRSFRKKYDTMIKNPN
jgi:transmembrane sensor